ncbi:MAG: MarR family winged helix-turn-helix transcriptional regulator [Sedimentitalea sp.]
MSDHTLRQFSGYSMKRAFAAVQADVSAALAPFGLRMLSFSALVLIVDNPRRRQSQLADALAIERPNLVIVVDELERAGLITRERTAADKRAYALEATAAGRRLYDETVRVVQQHEARMTQGLDASEHAILRQALRSIELAGKGAPKDG